jgi:hypothetical protein
MRTLRPGTDVLTLPAPLGIRFWDGGAGRVVDAGLSIRVYPAADPARSARATPNRAGIYVLPGLAATSPWAGWPNPPAEAGEFTVEVSDQAGRFLPCRLSVRLPQPGLLSLAGCAPLDGPLLAVELLSAPARPLPAARAAVRAELYDIAGAGRPASWAVLEIWSGGQMLGRGMADERGRTLVVFPYPAPRRLISSPPSPPASAGGWTVELRAFYSRGDPATIPELCPALPRPAVALLESLSPYTPLAPRELLYGRELVIATGPEGVLLLDSTGSPPHP